MMHFHTTNKKLSGLIKALSLFFWSGLLFSTNVLTVSADWYDSATENHSQIPYSEIHYQDFDPSKLQATLQEMEALCQEPGNGDKIIADYQIILEEFDHASTASSLNSLRYYNDVNNQEYQDIDAELTNLITDLYDQTCHTLHIVMHSNYYNTLAKEINDPSTIEFFLSYTDMTDEEKELKQTENDLVQKYDQESMKEFTYTDEAGTIWTQDKLNNSMEQLADYEQFWEINNALAKARNEVLAPIYLDLVKCRNRQAILRKYDNYAEYAYAEIYNRDYTTEDIQSVYQSVKKYFTPAQQGVYENTMSILDYSLMDMPDLDQEQAVEAVGKIIKKIEPQLMEAYQYMCDKHLYDIEYSDTKMDLGYTDFLYDYGAPVIFNQAGNYYYDYSTIIHEFGHYNHSYHNDKHSFTDGVNMDVAEIHSQGLEMLALKYSDRLYGAKADSARLLVLYNMASSVIDGCLYDEFQNDIYASKEELTVEDLNKLFAKLATEYGLSEEQVNNLYYSWVDVSHTFQSPMYYISYATSALSALDILSIAQTDRKEAIDKYMKLTTYNLNTPYREMMTIVGLGDIFDEEIIQSIATNTLDYSEELASHGMLAGAYRTLRITGIVILVLIVVIACGILFLEKKLKTANVSKE